MIQVYFFDASAIVKLLVKEPGSPLAHSILSNQHNHIFTSWVVLGETLGVLKRKFLKGELSEDLYGTAVQDLFVWIKDRTLKTVDVKAIDDDAVLETFDYEIQNIRKLHPKIDVADALQLAAIQNSILRYFVGESQPRFVTADGVLADIAEGSGILVTRVNK